MIIISKFTKVTTYNKKNQLKETKIITNNYLVKISKVSNNNNKSDKILKKNLMTTHLRKQTTHKSAHCDDATHHATPTQAGIHAHKL